MTTPPVLPPPPEPPDGHDITAGRPASGSHNESQPSSHSAFLDEALALWDACPPPPMVRRSKRQPAARTPPDLAIDLTLLGPASPTAPASRAGHMAARSPGQAITPPLKIAKAKRLKPKPAKSTHTGQTRRARPSATATASPMPSQPTKHATGASGRTMKSLTDDMQATNGSSHIATPTRPYPPSSSSKPSLIQKWLTPPKQTAPLLPAATVSQTTDTSVIASSHGPGDLPFLILPAATMNNSPTTNETEPAAQDAQPTPMTSQPATSPAITDTTVSLEAQTPVATLPAGSHPGHTALPTTHTSTDARATVAPTQAGSQPPDGTQPMAPRKIIPVDEWRKHRAAITYKRALEELDLTRSSFQPVKRPTPPPGFLTSHQPAPAPSIHPQAMSAHQSDVDMTQDQSTRPTDNPKHQQTPPSVPAAPRSALPPFPPGHRPGANMITPTDAPVPYARSDAFWAKEIDLFPVLTREEVLAIEEAFSTSTNSMVFAINPMDREDNPDLNIVNLAESIEALCAHQWGINFVQPLEGNEHSQTLTGTPVEHNFNAWSATKRGLILLPQVTVLFSYQFAGDINNLQTLNQLEYRNTTYMEPRELHEAFKALGAPDFLVQSHSRNGDPNSRRHERWPAIGCVNFTTGPIFKFRIMFPSQAIAQRVFTMYRDVRAHLRRSPAVPNSMHLQPLSGIEWDDPTETFYHPAASNAEAFRATKLRIGRLPRGTTLQDVITAVNDAGLYPVDTDILGDVATITFNTPQDRNSAFALVGPNGTHHIPIRGSRCIASPLTGRLHTAAPAGQTATCSSCHTFGHTARECDRFTDVNSTDGNWGSRKSASRPSTLRQPTQGSPASSQRGASHGRSTHRDRGRSTHAERGRSTYRERSRGRHEATITPRVQPLATRPPLQVDMATVRQQVDAYIESKLAPLNNRYASLEKAHQEQRHITQYLQQENEALRASMTATVDRIDAKLVDQAASNAEAQAELASQIQTQGQEIQDAKTKADQALADQLALRHSVQDQMALIRVAVDKIMQATAGNPPPPPQSN